MPTARDPWFDDLRARGELLAAVTAVVDRTGTIDVRAHGEATPDAIVRLHSMSKAITAVAFLALVERGTCALDDTLGRWVPGLATLRSAATEAPSRSPVRLRHLLSHTAGLPYPNTLGNPAERAMAGAIGADPGATCVSLSDYAERLRGARLAHEPGDGLTYGVSIDLLGHVIERITDRPLADALASLVTGPLGMVDTGFALAPSADGRVLPIHRRREPSRFERLDAPVGDPRLPSGGGGLVGTARDYARFAAMLLRGGELDGARILSESTVRRLSRCELGALRDRPAIAGDRHLGPGLGLSFVGRVVVDERAAHLGELGAFGWDGVCGNTFVVDPVGGYAGVLLTAILPWPEGLHRSFRAAVRDDARAMRAA